MEKIDMFFLMKFQSFSDWFQCVFGKNNFFLARIFLRIFQFIVIAICIVTNLKELDVVGILFVILITWIMVPSIKLLIMKVEAASNNKPEVMSLATVKLANARTLVLLLVVFELLLFLIVLGAPEEVSVSIVPGFVLKILMFLRPVCFMSIFYFISCTPKPPKKSRIKKIKERVGNFKFGGNKMQPSFG